jgi:hypothetical protein
LVAIGKKEQAIYRKKRKEREKKRKDLLDVSRSKRRKKINQWVHVKFMSGRLDKFGKS